MAGDWVKVEHTLPDKPEVVRMALDLGIDQDAVAGKLLRIWIWADQNTIGGHDIPVTYQFLDRLAVLTGFANAMRKVGWLEGREGLLSFPRFDRHNGQTAKLRAENNRRKAKSRNGKTSKAETREDGPPNPETCPESVTEKARQKARPEKRREEKEETNVSPPAPKLDSVECLALPDKLRTDAFQVAWARWVQHRREIKHPLKPTQADALLRKFFAWGPERSVIAIDHSVANGWRGIFEPDEGATHGRPSDSPGLFSRSGTSDPARVRTGATAATLADAMAKAEASRGGSG